MDRTIDECADRIRAPAGDEGAISDAGLRRLHAIKNGLGPVLIRLMEHGCVTHLATNGAGIIHDWELAFQGRTSEDVRANVAEGKFGIWSETGFNINLALVVGVYRGLGYGEAVGTLIENECLELPDPDELAQEAARLLPLDAEKAAAAADLLSFQRQFQLGGGTYRLRHPYKQFSAQAAAFRLRIPFTAHPMIGHDIIYCHPANHGPAVGRTALRDFLVFARGVQNLAGGVYMSIGSAVMSPMIFEKSLSMAQNVQLQAGSPIRDHFIVVADLAESRWDWASQGEPPTDDPAYYLRYCKTFSRMGGEMRYVTADNRDFLLALLHRLQ